MSTGANPTKLIFFDKQSSFFGHSGLPAAWTWPKILEFDFLINFANLIMYPALKPRNPKFHKVLIFFFASYEGFCPGFHSFFIKLTHILINFQRDIAIEPILF